MGQPTADRRLRKIAAYGPRHTHAISRATTPRVRGTTAKTLCYVGERGGKGVVADSVKGAPTQLQTQENTSQPNPIIGRIFLEGLLTGQQMHGIRTPFSHACEHA
jgi:hypothetical protein